MGFKPNALRQMVIQESFDPNFKFKPFKLYMITTDDDKWAITTEQEQDVVYLAPPDPKNKYQWVLIDGDTGAIAWFSDLKSYMSFEEGKGIMPIKRTDVIGFGTFEFMINDRIRFKSKPQYYLCYRKDGPKGAADSGAAAGAAEEKPADAPAEEKKAEGFLSRLFESFVRGFEPFDANKDIILEAVHENDMKGDLLKFGTTWKYVEIMDLRTMTDNADTIEELTKVGNSNSAQITALQKIIENNKEISDIEIKYRDDKIKGYEENRFVRLFL